MTLSLAKKGVQELEEMQFQSLAGGVDVCRILINEM